MSVTVRILRGILTNSQQQPNPTRERAMVAEQQERLTLTPEECARLLGIGRTACYEAIRVGRIPVVKIGKRYLIPKAALQKMLDAAGSDNPQA